MKENCLQKDYCGGLLGHPGNICGPKEKQITDETLLMLLIKFIRKNQEAEQQLILLIEAVKENQHIV